MRERGRGKDVKFKSEWISHLRTGKEKQTDTFIKLGGREGSDKQALSLSLLSAVLFVLNNCEATVSPFPGLGCPSLNKSPDNTTPALLTLITGKHYTCLSPPSLQSGSDCRERYGQLHSRCFRKPAFTFQLWPSFIIYYYKRMKQLIWPGARLLQAELHQHGSEVTKEKKPRQNQPGFVVRTDSSEQ